MAVHAICPSVRCKKILTFAEDVRGTTVTCRYCDFQFRVPQIRHPAESSSRGATMTITAPAVRMGAAGKQ